MKRMNASMLQFVVLGLLALVASASAQAQNAIENFSVSQQGGQVLVRVTTKAPLGTAPASFTVASPARIAFDFPNTVNGLGRTAQDVGQGELRSMNVVQVGDRTRMVLNLRNMVQHEAKVDGRSVLITLTPSATAAQPAQRFAEGDRKSTRLNSSHIPLSRMPSSA